MLKATGITKIYSGIDGDNRVLDELDFHGNKGQLCIITGPSGCGKSTLLNVLSSLDSATSGTIEINGKLVEQDHRTLCRVRRNDIGFIFQGYNLISTLTAAENVELSLKYRRVPRAKRKTLALEALEKVGLGHRANYLPHQLSGGQQQRVAIARAMVAKPAVLFCDEPTGNLDPDSAAMVMEQIVSLKNEGTLVVMITHDLSLLSLADRVLHLEGGKLTEKTTDKGVPHKNTSPAKWNCYGN